MSVTASINPLPVYVTDADVNRVAPKKEEDWVVNFGDPNDSVEEFPFCCAIGVIGHAIATEGDYDREIESLTPQHGEAFLKAMKEEVAGRSREGLILYTVTDNQVVERAGLEAVGFQIMAVFKNPKTGNRITLYGLLVNQPRSRPVHPKAAKKKLKRK